MKFRRKLAAFMAACVLGTASFTGMEAEAAEIPEYMRSVTYFGDEWPINYWNSEDKNMEENMARIAADGFNSLILVIPWREFQPSEVGSYFNERAFARLDQVMDCAERHGLGVVLRLGYVWDYLGATETPKRFAAITKDDGPERKLWLEYSKKVYETAAAHENFWGGFITWEDFWNYTENMGRDMAMSSRIRMAKDCGYQAYLEENYTLDQVRGFYGPKLETFEQVYIPYKDHPSAELFYEFYDHFLTELTTETQAVFPGLSLEIRADGDIVYDGMGGKKYYSHSATYPCPGADYAALMYSVSMGQVNTGNKIPASEALAAMTRNLDSIYAAAGKPLYIEQLLYMDSTEAFSHNTQVEDEQVGTFVRSLAPVLSGRTNGYGLWVYRNYVNNAVYNSQFALDQEGWSFSGDSRIEERNGSKAAVIGKKGSISQDLDGRIPGSSRIHVEFYAEAENGGASVTVRLGGDEQTIHVGEGKTYRMEFASLPRYTFSITAERRIHVDDIRVYTYEQNGRIYERDGSAGDLAGDFRALNGKLAAGGVPAGGMAAGTPDAGEVHSGQQTGEMTAAEAPSAAAE